MTTDPLDLDAIAAALRAASARPEVTFDATVLPAAAATAVAAAFGLPTGTFLALAGVLAAGIPDPATDPLTVHGTASVLRVADVPVDVTLHTSGTVTVVASMGDSWRFADSFPDLATFPFDMLTLAGPHFVYSSTEQPAYPWPDDPATTVRLAAGLNLLADAGLTGFPVVAELLGTALGTGTRKLAGPFGPAPGRSWPVGTLRAPLAGGTFSVGAAPFALTLTEPAIGIRITTRAGDPAPEIDLLVEGVFQGSLTVEVRVPPDSGGSLGVRGTPVLGHGSIGALLASLPGGADAAGYIPAELAGAFSEIRLDEWSLTADLTPSVSRAGIAISTGGSWPIIPGALTLDALALRADVFDPAGTAWTRVRITAEADLLPEVFGGRFTFTVDLARSASWEVSAVTGRYLGSVTLADLVGGLAGPGVAVPAELSGLTFCGFGVEVTRGAPGQPYTYAVTGTADLSFPLLGTGLSGYFSFSATKTAGGFAVALGGRLVVGAESFGFTVDLGPTRTVMRAAWQDSGTPLGFADLAEALGWTDPPALPGDLDLALTAAGFEYDFGSGTLVLTATSQHGRLVFVTATPAGARAYLLDVAVPLAVRFSDLPVAGPQIPAALDVGVDRLELVVSSAPFPADVLTRVNATLIALGAAPLRVTELPGGARLDATLELGGTTETLALALGGGS